MHTQPAALAGLLLAATGALFGQNAPKPEFDAATVRPSAPITDGRIRVMMSGGPGTPDPGRLNYENVTLRSVLTKAYGVKTYQISGPAWLDSERFDLTAKVPAGTSKEQFGLMLQNLLAERFKMTLHREKKELPAYALVVGKGGSKLKPSAPEEPASDPAAPPPPPPSPGGIRMNPQMGRDGFPQMPAGMGGRGMAVMMMPGRAKVQANRTTIARLTEMLEQQLDRAVIDETGLQGNYDFTLVFEPDASRGMMGGMGGMLAGMGRSGPGGPDGQHQPDSEPAANLFTAVQEQLGLKLDARKSPVEMLVIDRLEKTPTEN